MQVITRNPIASPSTLGVNSGAAFFIIMSAGWLGISGLQSLTWVALIGAAVSGGIVFFLGSIGRGRHDAGKNHPRGCLYSRLLPFPDAGLMLSDGKMFDQVLVWLVGSVAGRDLNQLASRVAVHDRWHAGALLLGRHLNALSMGDDIAQSLGQNSPHCC